MKRNHMRAIILAAGRGSRLENTAGDVPKCLARVGAATLLERQISALRAAGVSRIVVVTGYRAGLVRALCGDAVTCIENTRHAVTNSLYSLWLARDFLGDGFVVMNGDVLLHPRLLIELLASPYEDALLISYRDGSAPLGDEEMKVVVRDGRVVEITKQMDGREADGENVGVVKFGATGARLLVERMDALIASGAERDWAPRAFREFAQTHPLHVVSTGGLPWIEIDYPSDYRRALNEVMPLIEMDEALADESLAVAVAAD